MYKKKSIPLSLKALVWNKYIGEEKGIGYCQCCRKNIIKQISFHCGHIISEKNGGSTTLNNLIPLCQTCNLSMGKQNMNDFVKKYGFHDNNSDSSNIFNNNSKFTNNIVINNNEMYDNEMNNNEIYDSEMSNNKIINNKITHYEKIISTDLINLDNEDFQTINFLTMYFNAKKNKIE
jgi:hypothetical protein